MQVPADRQKPSKQGHDEHQQGQPDKNGHVCNLVIRANVPVISASSRVRPTDFGSEQILMLRIK
jgi:hypothetical protein